MEEYRFELLIAPESYDYSEEEIVYRIYFDDQLIIERSLPILTENQGIVDIFFIKLKKNNFENELHFLNCGLKKAKLKKIFTNTLSFAFLG